MEPIISLYSSILLLGAAHGLFLALALVNVKGGNTLAHRLLTLLTVTFSVDLGVDFLRESYYLTQFPKLNFVEDITSFLYGPLVYLYVSALTSKGDFHFSGGKWVHFLPFAASILLLIPFINLSDDHVRELIYSNADVDDSMGLWIIGGLLVDLLPIPLIGFYLVLSFRKLSRHRRDIRDYFSSIERISLTWLRNLLMALLVLFLIYMLALFFSRYFGFDKEAEGILNIATIIVIYTIGYMGIRQPIIFSSTKTSATTIPDLPEKSIEDSNQQERKKYEKSALNADMSKALLEVLQHTMADEKPYLESQLTLNQLAERVGVSTNYLSQIINEQTGSHFFDYINQHRVEAAKMLLADPTQTRTSILTVAMEVGFNSKSAFYTAFRKHAGLTPSQFRKLSTTE